MQTETMAVAPTIEGEATETAMPAPDLSVLAEQPQPVEQGKDDKVKPQELTETSPASVGLVVALVVVSIVAAVVVAMWMVSPLMALLLGVGLIVVAVLAGVGWLAWRKYTRRSKTGKDRSGRDGTGRGDRPGKSPNGRGKGDSWWPFSRSKTPGGGGQTPGGAGKTPGGKTPKGGTTPGGGRKPAGAKSGSWWPFGRDKTPGGGGKTPGGKTSKSPKGGTTPGGAGKPAGDGGKKPGGKTGRWPFGRPKTPGDNKTPGGGKPPASGKTPGVGAKPTSGGGAKPRSDAGRKAKTAGGAALLGLLGLARGAKNKSKSTDDKATESDKPAGKDEPAATAKARPAPGGHRPETVIDVDLDDITVPGGRPSSSSSGPTASAHRTTPRTDPFYDSGPTAGSEWVDRPAPMPLHSTAHHQHQTPVSNHLGGPEMSTTTDIDQDAMRVANRYAEQVEKAQTLQARARACRDAADQYRRDARNNQESAENHKQAARTIRDANVAHEHAVSARDAEAEAAREILAARYYEEQAEAYEAQARSIGH
ncbi:hypothetical protein [Micromonospora sp. DT62]|uniref:hypothetical protein n=1 Tax=Micromonospora sp. DT62 TaxID=3416521 RepID=UPI003CEB2AE7